MSGGNPNGSDQLYYTGSEHRPVVRPILNAHDFVSDRIRSRSLSPVPRPSSFVRSPVRFVPVLLQAAVASEADLVRIPFDSSRIVAPACNSILPFTPDLAESRMEVARAPIMFEKTLTHSDTSGGGRIVIPKAIAETHFPSIDDPSGCVVPVVDVFGETRGLRFRYWVNNNSRMYILEGVGPLLKLFKLSVGDVLIFGKDEDDHLVICGRKVGFIGIVVVIIVIIVIILFFSYLLLSSS